MERNTLDFWRAQCDAIWLETMAMVHPGKDIDQAIRQSYGHLIASPDRLQNSTKADFKRLVNTWLTNSRQDVRRTTQRGADLTNL